MDLMHHGGIENPEFQKRIDVATQLVFTVWIGLMVVALINTNFDFLGLFAPYVSGKSYPWARGRIGGSFDAFISFFNYLHIMLAAAFGIIWAVSKNPRTRALALVVSFLSIPFFLLDRTRNVMLAVVLPGLLAWVFLRLKGGLWLKTGVLLGAFLVIEGWMKFVIDTRSGANISQVFRQIGIGGVVEKVEGSEASSLSDLTHEVGLIPATQFDMARFVNIDRDTPMLLPPDMRDWVPSNHLVHFLIDAIDGVDTSTAQINHRGTGSEQYPPAMLLTLLVYSYCTGIFSSRQIELSTHTNVAARLVCANTHPDHDTLCTFRRNNGALLRRAFAQILEMAAQCGVLKVGQVTVAIDGTKVLANASKHAAVSYGHAEQKLNDLEIEIQELLASPNDKQELAEDFQAVKENVSPAIVLVDSGFVSESAVTTLEAENPGLEVLAAMKREPHGRTVQQLEKSTDPEPPPADADFADKMKYRTSTAAGRALYKLRQQTVEPIFGIIKEAMGFRRFSLRGHAKVSLEWNLVCLAYNLKRLHIVGAKLRAA